MKTVEQRLPVIGIIGASDAPSAVLEIAEDVGVAVFERGWHLICGGGAGVMEAACKGFHLAKGSSMSPNLTIGVLPSDTSSFANPWVDISLPTGMGWARNAIITRAAHGVVAVGGCSGTLSEIAFAWAMGKPIVALGGSGGWAGKLAGQAIDSRRQDTVLEARNGVHAMELLALHLEG